MNRKLKEILSKYRKEMIKYFKSSPIKRKLILENKKERKEKN
ncbi:MAG: hypothetical protein NY202_00015 [Mollicutes bacterium UO1]